MFDFLNKGIFDINGDGQVDIFEKSLVLHNIFDDDDEDASRRNSYNSDDDDDDDDFDTFDDDDDF